MPDLGRAGVYATWIYRVGVVAAVVLLAVGAGYLLGRGEGRRHTAEMRPAPPIQTPAKPPRHREPESQTALPKPTPEPKNAEPKPPESKLTESRLPDPRVLDAKIAELEREAEPVREPATPPREIAALPAPTPAPHPTMPVPPRDPAPSRDAAVPPTRLPGSSAWQRNAVPARESGGRPVIALMFDDVGVNRAQARKTIQLRGPLTLSFMSYADDLPALTAGARSAGHELMLHLPMEPLGTRISPGPEALLVNLDNAEIARRTEWALGRFDGLVGVNNHMGSRFTADRRGMGVVLAQLKARGLLFVDSMTTPASVGGSVASQLGVPYAERDVFLDHVQDRAHVRASLARLEERARAKGYAIGIGHPHEETLDEVRPWLASLESRGFVLVPVSAIVRRLRDAPDHVARSDAAQRVVKASEPAASAVR